jgi:hypothetical protein
VRPRPTSTGADLNSTDSTKKIGLPPIVLHPPSTTRRSLDKNAQQKKSHSEAGKEKEDEVRYPPVDPPWPPIDSCENGDRERTEHCEDSPEHSTGRDDTVLVTSMYRGTTHYVLLAPASFTFP